ncbi:hypothetical protein HDV00_005680 [Rhizophlyctis rosea]|nr:hypothetical protein HDV00_005680 [Rhizophlyctis rosea]
MRTLLALLPLLPGLALAADATTCGLILGVPSGKCSQGAPCCSSVGYCGVEAIHCGPGCQSDYSYDNSTGDNASCFVDRPSKAKQCVSGFYDFKDTTWVINEEAYNGDVNQADFTLQNTNKNNVQFGKNGGVRLILTAPTANSGGAGVSSKLSTTSYMMYGTFSANIKTSPSGGVVTAFISMSDEKDEIDWEITGADTTVGQSNYFFKGVEDHTKGAKHKFSGGQDLSQGYHNYTVVWKETSIEWFADGVSDKSNLPSTPSRIQFALWDGGSGSAGTRAWAGGQVNYNSGQNYATWMWVSIQCAGDAAPTGPPKRQTGYKPPNVLISPIKNSVPTAAGYQKDAMQNSASASGGQVLGVNPAASSAERMGVGAVLGAGAMAVGFAGLLRSL